MTASSNVFSSSYTKTTVLSAVLAAAGSVLVLLVLRWLPGSAGYAVAAFGLLATLAALALAVAGVIVGARYARSRHGGPDLFLELNRSREREAVEAAAGAPVARMRRWLARWLLGHDLVVGDIVEVMPWDQIRATLDERGCLDELPFMPEMRAMCGRRAVVFRCLHRLFDYRKSRRMRHMDGAVLLVGAVCDGSSHGGCEAACHTIWKSAWLRRVERSDRASQPMASAPVVSSTGSAVAEAASQAPRYVCQLTQLQAASRPIGEWSFINFLRPLVSGNVAPAAFAVGWLTNLFNEVQHLRGGMPFPAFEPPQPDGEPEDAPLTPGDEVIVKSCAAISATLNDRQLHRGMWFEPDMLKYSGLRCTVEAEVRKIIDIVTGQMRTMKTPAYLLRDVHFSGERQHFNAQHEPLFWRSVWLKQVSK